MLVKNEFQNRYNNITINWHLVTGKDNKPITRLMSELEREIHNPKRAYFNDLLKKLDKLDYLIKNY